MSRIRRKLIACLALTGLALLSVGCPQQEAPAPEPDAEPPGVVIELKGFDVTDWAPVAIDVATEDGNGVAEAAEMAAAGEAAEGELEAEEELEQGPATATILFELLLRFKGPGEAPEGVDLAIVHSDPSAQEKGRYQERVVTHEMERGEQRLEYLEFEILDYEDGDEFSVIKVDVEAILDE